MAPLTRVMLVLLLLFSGTLASAVNRWSADLGLGGFIVPGTWAPLRLSVPAGEQAWTVEITALTGSGRAAAPVVLAHATGGQAEDAVFIADATRALKLRFLSGGVVRDEQTLDLGPRLFPGHLIGTSGLESRTRLALAEVLLPQEPVRVIDLPPGQLPRSPLNWSGLAALVLADPGPILSPTQVRAVRAWLGSGGVLVLTAPREGSASLGSQLGTIAGLGRWLRVDSPEVVDWKQVLGLRPYGDLRRLGSDFDPPARGLAERGSRHPWAAIVLVLVWAGLGSLLLVLRSTAGRTAPLVWSALATVVVVTLGATGQLDWDRGLPIHGREVVLPGDLGRYVSIEATLDTTRSGPMDWSDGSPWALAAWRAQPTAASVRVSRADRVSLESFEPAKERRATYRLRVAARAVVWSQNTAQGWTDREDIPEELKADGPWLTRIAASRPALVWSVGLDGNQCWIRPEVEGGAL